MAVGFWILSCGGFELLFFLPLAANLVVVFDVGVSGVGHSGFSAFDTGDDHVDFSLEDFGVVLRNPEVATARSSHGGNLRALAIDFDNSDELLEYFDEVAEAGV